MTRAIDGGEAANKGSIKQRAVLTRGAALVEQLYAKPASSGLIVIE